jgi:hypothetical protein
MSDEATTNRRLPKVLAKQASRGWKKVALGDFRRDGQKVDHQSVILVRYLSSSSSLMRQWNEFGHTNKAHIGNTLEEKASVQNGETEGGGMGSTCGLGNRRFLLLGR